MIRKKGKHQNFKIFSSLLGHHFTLTFNLLYRLISFYTILFVARRCACVCESTVVRFHAYNYLFKLDNLALTHVALLQRCSDKLWARVFSLDALDPPSFCDRRDYRSLWTLDFCERSVCRRAQPSVWKIMKINGFVLSIFLSRLKLIFSIRCANEK